MGEVGRMSKHRPGSYVAFLPWFFTSIKCGRNATVDSCVELVLHLIQINTVGYVGQRKMF